MYHTGIARADLPILALDKQEDTDVSTGAGERVVAHETVPTRLPTACPILVGRSSSLAQLLWLAERAAEGEGQVALLVGDAGIGKSRLLVEATTQLLDRATTETAPGYLVLEGHCFEEDRHFPYAPLLDLLRRHLGGDGRGQPIGVREELLTELSVLLPQPGQAPAPVAVRSAAQAEREKRELQDALLHLLTDDARHRRVLLIVEDVHWSDEASLEFLHYLARHLTRQPMLLVLTYRDTDVSPGLGQLLAILERACRVAEIRLNPLSLPDVEAMLRAIFAQRQPIDPEFLQPIYAFTEGNPFFVEETLRALVASGDTFFVDGRWDRKPLDELHIPRAVRVAVQQRLP